MCCFLNVNYVCLPISEQSRSCSAHHLSVQAEEAAKRAAREAEVEKKRQEEKVARAAAAAEWREADWVNPASFATHLST